MAKHKVKLSNLDLDKILSANRKLLKPGRILTRAQFITLVHLSGVPKNALAKGDYITLHRQNMRLVAEQKRVNALMRLNGLCLKARNFYSEFEVCTKERTKDTIVRYAGQVERSEVAEKDLDYAMSERIHSGTWSTYNRVFDNKGQRKYPTPTVYTDTGRAAVASRRVKKY